MNPGLATIGDSPPHGVMRRWKAYGLRLLAITFTLGIVTFMVGQVGWHDRAAQESGESVIGHTASDGFDALNVGSNSDKSGQIPSTPVKVKTIGLQTLFTHLRWPWLLGFAICTFAIAGFVIYRWRLLIPQRDTDHRRAFLPYAIIWARSQVISMLPLSQIGGDMYRVERSRHHTGGLAPAATIIVLEKLLGFSALIVVALAGLYASGLFTSNRAIGRDWPIAIFALFAFGAWIVLTHTRRRRHRRAEPNNPPVPQTRIARIWHSVQPVVPKPGKLLAALVLSGGIQAISPLCYWFIDRALGLNTPLWCYLVAIPAITLAQYFPIHIAGIGVLEGGLWLFLHSWAGRTANEVLAISATSRVLSLAWLALLGLSFLAKVSMTTRDSPITTEPDVVIPGESKIHATKVQTAAA